MPKKSGSGRVGKRRYPRAEFDYVNYDTDPHPDILVLGFWKAKSTKHNLTGGINLNYLSKSQLGDLQRNIDRLFSRSTLKSRYRFLKERLPEIAQYYRTYDQRFIRKLEAGDLTAHQPAAGVDNLRKRALQKTVDAMGGKPSPVRPVASSDREAWRARRRLYEPETGQRTAPERKKGAEAGAASTTHQKNLRYRQQKRKLDNLENQAELERLQGELGDYKTPEEPPLPDIDPEVPDLPDIPDDEMSESVGRPITYTILEYIRKHSPKEFSSWCSTSPGRRIALFNTKTGQLVLDCGKSHDYMLLETGWHRRDVVWAKLDNNNLVVEGTVPKSAINLAASQLVNADIYSLLVRKIEKKRPAAWCW